MKKIVNREGCNI